MLTGTAIENSAMEYFFPLNIVAPEIAHSKEHFKRTWLTDDGKRVKSWRLAEFRDMLKPYVLRREKGDVFTDLPELNRIFTVMKVENEALKKLYNDKLDEIEARSVSFTTFDGLGELAILRQIAALAKVDWAAEYLSEALDEDTTTKYAVGMHHHSVFNTLKYKLDTMNIGAVRFSGSESAEEKYRIEKNFAHNMKERVLIINMLAGGVGCDFHETPNVIALERQWNGAKESQFEHRFYNPDRKIMGNNNTTIEYVLAQGTIDEWWHNMVESKRKIFGETISNEWNIETDTVSFRSLLDQTIAGRLR
jgi:SNF2 family DNA or RNA helicase